MLSFELFLFLLFGLTMISMAILAVALNNLIRCIIAYAAASVSLAAIFFLLDSPFAAAFELTVGAGLISVLFLVALMLSGGEELEAYA